MSDTPQWYETNPALMEAEIAAMSQMCPEATYRILPDRRMYWQIPITVDIEGVPKNWMFLGVYREDHPSFRFGSSISVYPVSPSYDDLLQMVRDAGIERKGVPHTLRDGSGRVMIDCTTIEQVRAAERGTIASAASYIPSIKRWIVGFASYLRDQNVCW